MLPNGGKTFVSLVRLGGRIEDWFFELAKEKKNGNEEATSFCLDPWFNKFATKQNVSKDFCYVD